jgi:hypothetical protein
VHNALADDRLIFADKYPDRRWLGHATKLRGCRFRANGVACARWSRCREAASSARHRGRCEGGVGMAQACTVGISPGECWGWPTPDVR